VSEIPIDNAVAVEFSARKPAAKPAPAPAAAAAAPAAAPKTVTVTVPAGTTINVRLTQAIDADASKAGQMFKAVVDDPGHVAGAIVIPRGAAAMPGGQVEQSER
jgi:hypothetical protein